MMPAGSLLSMKNSTNSLSRLNQSTIAEIEIKIMSDACSVICSHKVSRTWRREGSGIHGAMPVTTGGAMAKNLPVKMEAAILAASEVELSDETQICCVAAYWRVYSNYLFSGVLFTGTLALLTHSISMTASPAESFS
jgi:hypothetical protein